MLINYLYKLQLYLIDKFISYFQYCDKKQKGHLLQWPFDLARAR